MADIERSIKVLLLGEDLNMDKTLSNASRDFDKFSKGVQDVTGPLADFGKKVVKIEAALIAMTAAGLIYAYNKSVDFETAVVSLEKILGDQADQIDVVKDRAIELSDAYGKSATSIVDSVTDFKRAGFDIAESMNLAEESMNLVIAAGEAGFEVAQSSEAIIAILKGFKAPADEVGRVVDILNKVSNEYATSVVELSTGMAKVSPIAAQMNMSFEETAGILVPIIEVFRSGDEASTALRTGLLKLIDDSAPVRAGLEAIGVSQRDANGALRNGKDILLDVAVAFQTAEENDKLFLATQLVGIRQAAKMIEVFDGLAYSTEITNVALGASGSRLEEVEKRLATSQIAIDRFKTGFENLGIAVGDKFKIAATGVIDGSTDIQAALRQIVGSDTFDPIWKALNSFFDDLGDALKQAAKDMPEAFKEVKFDGLIKSFKGLGDEVKQVVNNLLGGNIDLSTVKGLEEAAQRLVNLFSYLTNFTTGFIQGIQPMIKAIGAIGTVADGAAEDGAKLAGKITGLAETANTAFKYLDVFKGAVATLISFSIIEKLIKASHAIHALATASNYAIGSAAGKAGLLGLAALTGYTAGTLINEYVPGVKQGTQALFGFADGLVDFTGKQEAAQRATDSFDAAVEGYIQNIDSFSHDLGDLREQLQGLGVDVEGMPRDVVLSLAHDQGLLDANYLMGIARTRIQEVQEQADEQPVIVSVISDDEDVARILKEMEALGAEADKITEKERQFAFDIVTHEDGTIEYIKTEIEKIPDKKNVKIDVDPKKIPIELQVAELEAQSQEVIAQIEATSEIVRASIEWKAQLDIAEVQANAQIMEAAFDGIAATMESTGAVISDALGLWAGLDSTIGPKARMIRDQIEDENRMRGEAHDKQMEMLSAQIKMMEERAKAMARGDAMITINSDGLAPHLEAFMWEVLGAIQVRVNEEGTDMLLGAPA